MHRLWYCHSALCHLAHVLLVPVFVLVPLVSVAFGVQPLMLGWSFAIYATAHYGALVLVQSYCCSWAQLKSIWYSQVGLGEGGHCCRARACVLCPRLSSWCGAP